MRSYYVANKELLVPAVSTFKRSKELLELKQPQAALVFAVSTIELFLKACLLRPVVAGLVHSETLAELVVDASLAQAGYKRYEKLLAGLFRELLSSEIGALKRVDSQKPLLEEASALQDQRNAIIHRGTGHAGTGRACV